MGSFEPAGNSRGKHGCCFASDLYAEWGRKADVLLCRLEGCRRECEIKAYGGIDSAGDLPGLGRSTEAALWAGNGGAVQYRAVRTGGHCRGWAGQCPERYV